MSRALFPPEWECDDSPTAGKESQPAQALAPVPAPEVVARYEVNLAALRALAHNGDLRSATYEGWSDPRVRALGFDAVGTPKREVAELCAALRIDPQVLIAGPTAPLLPAGIASAVWELGLSALGRVPHAVLDPAASAGRLQESEPGWLQERDVVRVAVEPDPVFGPLLACKHGHIWEVRQAPIERAGFLAPCFDLIIGCIPFGDQSSEDVECDPSLRKRHLQSRRHEYLICKSVTLLKPGGIAAVIVHRDLLDREDTTVREWIFARTELVGAWRLPDAVWESQGGSYVADVLVLRRTAARL